VRKAPRNAPAAQSVNPYLLGIPSLPPALLDALDSRRPIPRRVERQLDAHVARLKALIRASREAHEREFGIVRVEAPVVDYPTWFFS